jgi:hypothetical protein
MAVSTGTALLIGGGLAAGGAVLSANAQKDAAKSAAKSQLEGQQTALDTQERIFDKQVEVQKPFREVGEKAIGLLSSELFKPLESTEAFQFRQNEANRALNQALAARGLFNSGDAIRKSVGLNQRLIDSEIGRRDKLLGSALGIGRNAVGLSTQTLGNFGDAASQIAINRGNIGAQRALSQGQINASLFNNLSSLPIQGLGAASQLGLFGA